MNTAKNICFWVILSSITVAAINSYAEVMNFTLENIMLDDGTQMTGTFSWTYDAGDFENGVGQFISLVIPHTAHNHHDLNATIDATESIEITLPNSTHDDGVDITLVLVQPLTPTTSSSIDLVLSKYEIGGNGFHTGLFVSGSIVPEIPISIATPDSVDVLLGTIASGGLADLAESDDQYLIFDPEFLTFRYQLEFKVDAASTTESPSAIEFSYESRTFSFVGTVDQEIELYNYDSGQFESVDTRFASATDTVVNVTPSGDPTRFIQAGTNGMQARLSYQNSLPFWVFSTQNFFLPYRVRADHIFWTITR